MSENNPDNQDMNLYEEETDGIPANQLSMVARLFTIGSLMLDTLEFFLAPRDMLNHIEGEFNQPNYDNMGQVNRNDDSSSPS